MYTHYKYTQYTVISQNKRDVIWILSLLGKRCIMSSIARCPPVHQWTHIHTAHRHKHTCTSIWQLQIARINWMIWGMRNAFVFDAKLMQLLYVLPYKTPEASSAVTYKTHAYTYVHNACIHINHAWLFLLLLIIIIIMYSAPLFFCFPYDLLHIAHKIGTRWSEKNKINKYMHFI